MGHYNYQIVVIGAGAGGLVVAIGAARAGKSVLLIEKGTYGGDCTNFGCVPSKSLIAAAEAAHQSRRLASLGIESSITIKSCAGALERGRKIVARIREHEEPEALNLQHVDTVTGVASFKDRHTLEVKKPDGSTVSISAKHIVVATGSHPLIPDIPGMRDIPFLTNESIFNLKDIPPSLAILGGGPIGCELGQAFQRLGTQVSIIQSHPAPLQKEEKEAQEVIRTVFEKEGVNWLLGYKTEKVSQQGGKVSLLLKDVQSGNTQTLTVSHLLVSTGRKPSIGALNLEAAGVKYTTQGITVDCYGRSSVSNIWVVGDANGTALFTHMAEYEARAVLTSLLLPWPLKKRIDLSQGIPRVTYTDPEVASTGISAEMAIKKYSAAKIAIYTVPFKDVDRAITADRTEGFIQVITKKWSSRILGATIVGPRAGEMLAQISTAMYAGIPFRKLSKVIYAYPTYGLATRKASDKWLSQTLLPFLARLVGKSH